MVAGLPRQFPVQPSRTSFSNLLPNAEGLNPLPTSPMKVTTAAARAAQSPCPAARCVYKLFQSGARVAFPERNAAVEESPEGSGGVVVAGQYQKGGLTPFKGINRPAVLRGKLVFKVSLRLVFGKDDGNAGRQTVSQIDVSAGFQRGTRRKGPLPQLRASARPSMREIQLLEGMRLHA